MKHVLPLLPYAFSALEPHIDMHTMILHHDKHHASYVQALNLALEAAPEVLQDKSAEWLLLNLPRVPEKIRTAVGTNAGGHVNHSLLWRSMSPDGGGAPSGPLAKRNRADLRQPGQPESPVRGGRQLPVRVRLGLAGQGAAGRCQT